MIEQGKMIMECSYFPQIVNFSPYWMKESSILITKFTYIFHLHGSHYMKDVKKFNSFKIILAQKSKCFQAHN